MNVSRERYVLRSVRRINFPAGSRLALGFKSLMALAGFVFALQVSTLLAQDENAAPPAPADNGAPMQGADQATGAVAPAQDAGNGGQDAGATFQTFYDGLANQGTWIQTNDYGYVWQPQVSDPNWAPYTAGHWVYTDDGWTWVSDEPWGWATYHYGRWVNIEGTGWVWVPGYTWGPAWVSWRYGEGNVGWAPLPPDSMVGVDYSGDDTSMDAGYHIGSDCDGYYGIGPAYYIFLPWNYLCWRDYHGHFCNRGDNFWRINHTTNVTNINVGGNKGGFGGQFRRVSAGGPQLAQVNAVSQTPFQKVNIVHTNQPGGGTLAGNSLALYAPHVKPGTTARPSYVGASILQTKINRGVDITQPLLVNAHMAASAATPEQIEQARLARSQAPAGAKVMTDNTTFRPVLQTPVTSLKPIVTQTKSHRGFSTRIRMRCRNRGAVVLHQIYAPPTRGIFADRRPAKRHALAYPYNPAPVYSSGQPVYQPQSHATSTARPAFNPNVTSGNGTDTGGASQSHVYERSSAPVSSAPVVHESSSSGWEQ